MKQMKGGGGFTMVEALVITVVGSILLLTIQTLFSRSVKSTLKGQDNLETIRAASQLFSELRKDLLACHSIKVPDEQKIFT